MESLEQLPHAPLSCSKLRDTGKTDQIVRQRQRKSPRKASAYNDRMVLSSCADGVSGSLVCTVTEGLMIVMSTPF
ncbi:hypothetical protein BaRGS_00015026, partial [Batillaria attramentaria]